MTQDMWGHCSGLKSSILNTRNCTGYKRKAYVRKKSGKIGSDVLKNEIKEQFYL